MIYSGPLRLSSEKRQGKSYHPRAGFFIPRIARQSASIYSKNSIDRKCREDFVMTTFLLIIHGLLAVALLGAITHQAVSVWVPARRDSGSFVGRMRSVSAAPYASAVVLLFILTAILGSIIYPAYRLNVRIVLEQYELHKANGAFELKEHLVAVGLGMLPAYWYFWRQPLVAEYASPRAMITAILAFIVWWGFIVGHVLNNIRGFEV